MDTQTKIEEFRKSMDIITNMNRPQEGDKEHWDNYDKIYATNQDIVWKHSKVVMAHGEQEDKEAMLSWAEDCDIEWKEGGWWYTDEPREWTDGGW